MAIEDDIDKLIESGDYSTAEKRVRELRDTNSNGSDQDLTVTLARTLLLQRKYEEAKELLKPLCDAEEPDLDALWLLASAYEDYEEFEPAIELFKRALEQNKRTAHFYYRLGRIHDDYRYKGRNREVARRYLRLATTGNDVAPEAFLSRLSVETRERANYVLKSGLKRFPTHKEMNEILCWRLYNSNDASGCLEAIQNAHNLGVESADLLVVHSLVLLQIGRYEEATDNLTKLDETHVGSIHAIRTLTAICFLEAANYELGLQLLEVVINDDLNNDLDFAAHFVSICCFIRQGDLASAEARLHEIPISARFEPPLYLSIFPGEFEFEKYFLEALDGLGESSVLESAAKSKAFRATYTCRREDKELNIEVLRTLRDDLSGALRYWPDDSELHMCLSEVLSSLKDSIGAVRHNWLGRVHLPSDDDYYPPIPNSILEAIFTNKSLVDRLFVEIDNLLEDELRYHGDRFAARCLSELIEFFHKKQAFQLVVQVSNKFSYQQLRSANSLFEIAYAASETGDKKRASNLYRNYLRDVGRNSGVLNNLAILEEGFGNLLEARKLLDEALQQDASHEKAQKNLARVRESITKIETEKRAVERAADLFVHETQTTRTLLARLYEQRTEENLIFCNHRKLATLMGVRNDKANQLISEFVAKKYFEEILDPAIAFQGKLLRVNPSLVPYLEAELKAADEAARISEISSNLSSAVLDVKYGYNEHLLDQLTFIESVDLAEMLKRDLREAVTSLVTASYKSALILFGSITEAILLDQLTFRAEEALIALESLYAETGTVTRSDDRRIDRWNLDRLLDVSLRVGLISANLYHWGHGIRDFRNLVHPAAEQRKSIEVSEENAQMAWTVVKRLVAELGSGVENQTRAVSRQ